MDMEILVPNTPMRDKPVIPFKHQRKDDALLSNLNIVSKNIMKHYAKAVQERQQKQVTKKSNVLQARALVLPNYEFKDEGHLIVGIKTS